ncbi:MAG: DMT family transporter [Alphaproteobacteria bacterium]
MAIAATPKDHILQGILLISLAMALFSSLNGAVKFLSYDFPIGQLLWARYVGALVVMVVVFFPKHGWGLFRPKRLGIQILRGVLLFASSSLYFNGLVHLPLATAATISICSPLLITALSVPFLGEAVGPRRWAAVVVGFSGALIVIRPGAEGTNPYILFVVASMTCGTFYALLTRKYSGEENAEVSATIATVVGAVLGSLWIVSGWKTPTEAFDITLICALGAFAAIGHWLFTMAFQRGPAAVIAPFSYLQLVGATFFGYILFNDFPDQLTWVGATVIIGSGVYIAHRERIRSRAKAVS